MAFLSDLLEITCPDGISVKKLLDRDVGSLGKSARNVYKPPSPAPSKRERERKFGSMR